MSLSLLRCSFQTPRPATSTVHLPRVPAPSRPRRSSRSGRNSKPGKPETFQIYLGWRKFNLKWRLRYNGSLRYSVTQPPARPTHLNFATLVRRLFLSRPRRLHEPVSLSLRKQNAVTSAVAFKGTTLLHPSDVARLAALAKKYIDPAPETRTAARNFFRRIHKI